MEIPRELAPDGDLFIPHTVLDRDSFIGGLPRLLVALEAKALAVGRFLQTLNHFINVLWLQFVGRSLCHRRYSKQELRAIALPPPNSKLVADSVNEKGPLSSDPTSHRTPGTPP